MLEALDDFWTCNALRFARSKRVLRLMLQHSDRMLRPEGVTIRSVIGADTTYSGPLNPSKLIACMRFCVGLTVGQRAGKNDGSRAFDVQGFRDELHTYREQYIKGREDFRADLIGRLGLPAGHGFDKKFVRDLRIFFQGSDWPRTYVSNLLGRIVTEVDQVAVDTCVDALQARLAFDTAVVESMLVDGYNPRSHRGDCFDAGLLTHLAEPGLMLITSDRRMIERTESTGQGQRILQAHALCAS